MVDQSSLINAGFKPQDYIGFSTSPELNSLVQGERILFADKIKKTNLYNWEQERVIVITPNGIYNIHKKSIKRKLDFAKISAVTKTIGPSSNTREFTIHLPEEYDYRYLSDRREAILDIIKRRFYDIKRKNLPMFGTSSPNLKDFTTTEKDKRKQNSRFPPPDMRLASEDLVTSGDVEVLKKDSTVENIREQESLVSYEEQIQVRGKQHAANQDTTEFADEGFDEVDRQTRQSMTAGGKQMFNRGKDDAKLEDFQIRKMLGKGTFGKVFLVQNCNTNKLYAMKCIRKDIVIENEQIENIELEKKILYTIEHQFLVNMEYVFQNEFRIYFMMHFVKGGELFRHLIKVRRFPEDQAKFFVTQVALALGHLHSKKIIYRDLKPENILFNDDGYLLLADFGLAKFLEKGELANSFCGTAEYLAPEMLIGNGHDQTVDWWALGILLYEMIVGIPPFFHRNKHRMYYLIKDSAVNFPDPDKHKIYISQEAKDLILKLLDKNRKTRLGAKNDIEEILQHPFFASIDIEKMLAKELVPPYKPEIGDDLAYFDQKLVQQNAEEVAESIIDNAARQIVQKQQHQFDGFSS